MASASSSSSLGSDFEQFGQNIFSNISQQSQGKNVFLSSASIALALSMCAAGARHNTLQQMLSTLQVSSVQELIKTAEELMSIFTIAANDKQVQLRLGNRLYGQKNYQLRDEYLNVVRTSFKADMQLEDFVNEGPRVVQTINTWVEDQTNRLIRNLLSPGDIGADTRLVIVNCIYFKGVWRKQFDKGITNENADFYGESGAVSKVPLMYVKEKFSYAENKDLRVQIAHLPYKSQSPDVEFVFTVILPNKGVSLTQVEEKLAAKPALMQQILEKGGARVEELLLYLPRFRMETSFNLNDVLKQMGIRDAFDDNSADFTGIVSPGVDPAGLCISKVIHKAFIEVNEQGESFLLSFMQTRNLTERKRQ